MNSELQNGLVSIVIPTYNRGGYIGRAIESVLDDSYPKKEIIVVDDGSVDNTSQVIDRLKKTTKTPIQFIPLSHGGCSRARNIGMVASSGEFILFLDSDDFFINNKIAKSINVFQDNPRVKVVYSDWYIQGSDGTQTIDQADHKNISRIIQGNFNYPTLGMQTNSPVWKRSFLNEHHIKWIEELSWWEHSVFSFQAVSRLGLVERIFHLSEPLYVNLKENQESITFSLLNTHEKIVSALRAYHILYLESMQLGQHTKIQWHYIQFLHHLLHRCFMGESHSSWTLVVQTLYDIRKGLKPMLLRLLPFKILLFAWKTRMICLVCFRKNRMLGTSQCPVKF